MEVADVEAGLEARKRRFLQRRCHGGAVQQGKVLWWGYMGTMSASAWWSGLSAVAPSCCGALAARSSKGAQRSCEKEEKGVAAEDWERRRGAVAAQHLLAPQARVPVAPMISDIHATDGTCGG